MAFLSTDLLLALLLLVFLFPLAWSPGPGNTFFAALGASRGTRATVLPLLGFVGSLCLLWLAYGLLRRDWRRGRGPRSRRDVSAFARARSCCC